MIAMSLETRTVVKSLLLFSLPFLWNSSLMAQEPPKPNPGIVATFNGTPITDEELRTAGASRKFTDERIKSV
jgi:hypothetical protein